MRIAHLADLHLGYRAYHRLNSRGVNVREWDVAEAFRRVVAATAELKPDLVLVAGDVFHTVRPSNTAIAEAFRQFCVLTERLPGVPVVMIAGNHDSPRSADTGNILTLFREIDGVQVVCDDGRAVKLPKLDASILCLPHVALAGEELPPMEPDPKVKHNLLMLHAEVPSEVPGAPEHPTEYGGAHVPKGRIRAERWDYVALGHYHIHEQRAPNMWYPGGIERTSVNIWREQDPKGFLLFDTDEGRAEFQPVETRPVIDLRKISAQGMTAEEVDEQIRVRVEGLEDGIEGKIVRLVVYDAPRQLVRDLNHKRIREWKAEAVHFHLDARLPEVRRREGSGAPIRRQTLPEQVESFLKNQWEPTQPGIDKDRLVEMGAKYIDVAGGEG